MMSAFNFKHLCAWFAILILMPMTGLAQQATSETRTEPPSLEAEKQDKPVPRLKYRKGPVCMCSEGLSESEIQAAMKKKRLEK